MITPPLSPATTGIAGHERPFRLACFQDGARTDHPIEGDVVEAVAGRFGMDVTVPRAALEAVEQERA